jgi:DNA adenine methylase
MSLKAPFPYFGGKSSVANSVWTALGDVRHYIEPFFGSGAVLLLRPNHQPGKHVETVNDKDGFVANLWRALQFAPDEVARWCDWPVNHADLAARKAALIKNEGRLLENLIADEQWHDPVMAGFWIWAASCWIGSGLTSPGKRPHVSHGGKGVHALGRIPHVSDGGTGVHALGKIPHVSDGGTGVHALGKRPHVSHGGKGVQEPYNDNLYAWFRALSERLRYVRVVCGDWTRVCGGDWQDKVGTVGIFMDPPYGVKDRRTDIYHHDSTSIAAAVEDWCLERGGQPTYRIVVAGYIEEYPRLRAEGWRVQNWKARGGYSNATRCGGAGQGKINRSREALFFSPHCQSGSLFG